MKRITILLTLLLLSVAGWSQTTPSWVLTYLPSSPCAGSPVFFEVTDVAGVAVWPYAWWDFGDGGWGSGTSTSHVYATPGTFNGQVYVADSLSGDDDTLFFTIVVDPVCAGMDYVSGTAFFDDDGDGVMDPTELPLAGQVIEVTGGSLPSPVYFSTNALGVYGVSLPPGTYTISYDVPVWATSTAPAGGTHTWTSTGTGAIVTGKDFGYTASSSYVDLAVNACCGGHVPGFDRVFWLSYYNDSPSPQAMTGTWVIDPAITFVSASAGGVHAAGTVTWNLGVVPPFGSGMVSLTLHTPVALALGTPITHGVSVNIPAADAIPANNSYALELEVVGSYDPNDKKASPENTVEPGQTLDYTIRFQNTGTFYATHVILRDTLDDADLNLATLKVLGASHDYTWHLDENILVFEFMEIMLPDSNTDEPASHGFASYSVAAKGSITPGTEITNSASIYFDFNAPIVTNTTVNTYTVTAVVDEDAALGLQVFPNPFSEQATLRFDNPKGGAYTLTVTDLQGKVVRQLSGSNGNEISIERGLLTSGAYLFRLEASGEAATGKLIVQ